MRNKNEESVLFSIGEVKMVETETEVNAFLSEGWILLSMSTEKLLRFQKVLCGNNFEKVQPFDAYITRFILGKQR